MLPASAHRRARVGHRQRTFIALHAGRQRPVGGLQRRLVMLVIETRPATGHVLEREVSAMTSRDWDITATEEEQRSRAWESLGRRGLEDPRRCRQEARYHRWLARSARRNAERDRDDWRDRLW